MQMQSIHTVTPFTLPFNAASASETFVKFRVEIQIDEGLQLHA